MSNLELSPEQHGQEPIVEDPTDVRYGQSLTGQLDPKTTAEIGEYEAGLRRTIERTVRFLHDLPLSVDPQVLEEQIGE